jgi:hypothetical protein
MSDVSLLVAHISRTLGDLTRPQPEGEYKYSSVALCVIDAVFSIGVRYESTWRTVCDWARHYGWEVNRDKADREHTVSEFANLMQPYEGRWEQLAVQVFRNSQRTSSRSGILKAEATYRFAQALQRHQIETFGDALQKGLREEVKRSITSKRARTFARGARRPCTFVSENERTTVRQHLQTMHLFCQLSQRRVHWTPHPRRHACALRDDGRQRPQPERNA